MAEEKRNIGTSANLDYDEVADDIMISHEVSDIWRLLENFFRYISPPLARKLLFNKWSAPPFSMIFSSSGPISTNRKKFFEYCIDDDPAFQIPNLGDMSETRQIDNIHLVPDFGIGPKRVDDFALIDIGPNGTSLLSEIVDSMKEAVNIPNLNFRLARMSDVSKLASLRYPSRALADMQNINISLDSSVSSERYHNQRANQLYSEVDLAKYISSTSQVIIVATAGDNEDIIGFVHAVYLQYLRPIMNWLEYVDISVANSITDNAGKRRSTRFLSLVHVPFIYVSDTYNINEAPNSQIIFNTLLSLAITYRYGLDILTCNIEQGMMPLVASCFSGTTPWPERQRLALEEASGKEATNPHQNFQVKFAIPYGSFIAIPAITSLIANIQSVSPSFRNTNKCHIFEVPDRTSWEIKEENISSEITVYANGVETGFTKSYLSAAPAKVETKLSEKDENGINYIHLEFSVNDSTNQNLNEIESYECNSLGIRSSSLNVQKHLMITSLKGSTIDINYDTLEIRDQNQFEYDDIQLPGTIMHRLNDLQTQLKELTAKLDQERNEIFNKVLESDLEYARIEEELRTATVLDKEYFAMESENIRKVTEEKKKLFTDQDTICNVCGNGDSLIGNVIIICDRCNFSAHQQCYDVPEVPEDAWYCNNCKRLIETEIAAGIQPDFQFKPSTTKKSGSASSRKKFLQKSKLLQKKNKSLVPVTPAAQVFDEKDALRGAISSLLKIRNNYNGNIETNGTNGYQHNFLNSEPSLLNNSVPLNGAENDQVMCRSAAYNDFVIL